MTVGGGWVEWDSTPFPFDLELRDGVAEYVDEDAGEAAEDEVDDKEGVMADDDGVLGEPIVASIERRW